MSLCFCEGREFSLIHSVHTFNISILGHMFFLQMLVNDKVSCVLTFGENHYAWNNWLWFLKWGKMVPQPSKTCFDLWTHPMNSVSYVCTTYVCTYIQYLKIGSFFLKNFQEKSGSSRNGAKFLGGKCPQNGPFYYLLKIVALLFSANVFKW